MGEGLFANPIQQHRNQVLQTTNTDYGTIEVVKSAEGLYEILFKGKEIFRNSKEKTFIHKFSPTAPRPEVIKVIKLSKKSFSQVIVFQQFNEGNECEGNAIWFLALNPDGTYRRSTPIGNCFGNPPKIEVSQNKIYVTVEGGYPGGNKNRMVSYKRGGVWEYNGEKVRKLK